MRVVPCTYRLIRGPLSVSACVSNDRVEHTRQLVVEKLRLVKSATRDDGGFSASTCAVGTRIDGACHLQSTPTSRRCDEKSTQHAYELISTLMSL